MNATILFLKSPEFVIVFDMQQLDNVHVLQLLHGNIFFLNLWLGLFRDIWLFKLLWGWTVTNFPYFHRLVNAIKSN